MGRERQGSEEEGAGRGRSWAALPPRSSGAEVTFLGCPCRAEAARLLCLRTDQPLLSFSHSVVCLTLCNPRDRSIKQYTGKGHGYLRKGVAILRGVACSRKGCSLLWARLGLPRKGPWVALGKGHLGHCGWTVNRPPSR